MIFLLCILLMLLGYRAGLNNNTNKGAIYVIASCLIWLLYGIVI